MTYKNDRFTGKKKKDATIENWKIILPTFKIDGKWQKSKIFNYSLVLFPFLIIFFDELIIYAI